MATDRSTRLGVEDNDQNGSWYLSGAVPRLEARGLEMLLVPNAVS
jgi:hypothetical protein